MCGTDALQFKRSATPERFEQAQRDIEGLITQAQAGAIELAYVDEAGFAPQPPNRSAWTKSGETHAVTAKRAQRLNVICAHAVIGQVGHGKAEEKYQWVMLLCIFDGPAGTDQQAFGGDFGQCVYSHR